MSDTNLRGMVREIRQYTAKELPHSSTRTSLLLKLIELESVVDDIEAAFGMLTFDAEQTRPSKEPSSE